MSADVDGSDKGDDGGPVNITLKLGEETDLWIARDEDTGMTSQGPTRQAALSNLDEAVAGYKGAGDAPTEAELREFGIDPDENTAGDLESSDVFQ
ncbi:type II toxin-antitoxin system HicB family antitoxin [Halobellus rubicundus]|uniref:Type II toxin-antitoxin system HicB family antitoxin n=1 Tax=Halobellus rubicundus TaxID=2996466 RepID=A0ABD5MGW7_9EURY